MVVFAAFALGMGAALAAGWKLPLWIPLLLALALGTYERATINPWSGSDVLTATAEALGVLLQHANPYAHHFTTTNPQGEPFPYLPGELALYGIQRFFAGDLSAHDRYWGLGALFALAAIAPAVGAGRAAFATAFYAACTLIVNMSVDGSNDTAQGMLVIAAVTLLAWATTRRNTKAAGALFVLSAAVFGWAIAFKMLSWLVFPFVVAWIAPERRKRYVAIALATAAIFCLPFLIAGPVPFVRSIAGGLGAHANVWGFTLWAPLQTWAPGLAQTALPYGGWIDFTATVFAGIVLWPSRRPATLGEALARAAGVIGACFLFARWNNTAYYAYLFALLALAAATGGRLEPPADAAPAPPLDEPHGRRFRVVAVRPPASPAPDPPPRRAPTAPQS